MQQEQKKLEDALMIINYKIEETKMPKKEIQEFINKIKSLTKNSKDLDLVRELIERVDIYSREDKYIFNFIYNIKG